LPKSQQLLLTIAVGNSYRRRACSEDDTCEPTDCIPVCSEIRRLRGNAVAAESGQKLSRHRASSSGGGSAESGSVIKSVGRYAGTLRAPGADRSLTSACGLRTDVVQLPPLPVAVAYVKQFWDTFD
jgi:hypothetical protein